ncbi:MAG: nucleotide exchange factor GrpE [bacterium]
MILLSLQKHKKAPFIIDEMKEPISNTEIESMPNSSSASDLIDAISSQLQKIQADSKSVRSIGIQQKNNINQDTALFDIISDLVPVMDSMERSIELANTFPDNEILQNWMTNITAIYRKLRNVLMKQGLQEIETIGKGIDFNQHEVVEYRETNNYPEHTIIEEKQKGYLFRGKVIRDAKVVVAKPAVKS